MNTEKHCQNHTSRTLISSIPKQKGCFNAYSYLVLTSIIRGLLISNDIDDVVTINELSNYGRLESKENADISQLFSSISEKSTRVILSVNAGNSIDMNKYQSEVIAILNRILELL